MKLKSFLYTLLAGVALISVSCQPDELSLASTSIKPGDLVEGKSYHYEYDSENPNIVYLKSDMDPKYQALWEHPQGRSQASEVTLKMPFAGEYEFTFGVMTSAGPVYASIPAKFTIDSFCSEFVSDETWTFLTGGVGNSKKWFIDLDEEGQSRYFAGPITFYGLDDNWGTVTGGTVGTDSDKDSWNWDASYNDVADWQWTTTLMDYGYMEFDLNNGSNVHVVSNDLNYDETGLFMLNIDDDEDKTITFTDVQLLHDSMNDAQVESWTGEMKLLSLTENTMQIGVVRISDPCILSLNFISEDYYNSWIPEVSGDIELQDDWRDYVEPKTNYEMTFQLDGTKAYDWFDLDGNALDLYSGQNSDAEDISLVMYSPDGSFTFTSPDGTETEGTYTLSDNGTYTFSKAFPTIDLTSDGSAYLQSASDKTMQILALEFDDYTGGLEAMWLGVKLYDDLGKATQYLGYHFVVQNTGGEKKYNVKLAYFTIGWDFQEVEDHITEGGTYTMTINGSYSPDGNDPYGLYLDIYKILKVYPNLDIVINSIKVDETEILQADGTGNATLTDAIIDRGTGDDDTTARRYIVNPWGKTASDASNLTFSTSLSVTYTLTLDTGTPFIATE